VAIARALAGLTLRNDVADTAGFAVGRVEVLAGAEQMVQLRFKDHEFFLPTVHVLKLGGEES